MNIISKKNHIYSYRPDVKAISYVNSGEEVIFETYDSYKDQLTTESIDQNFQLKGINPATGPVYINGAEPGDTLKITVLAIELNQEGTMYLRPGAGVLKKYVKRSEVKKLQVVNGMIRYSEQYSFHSKPMIGVIGVAPESGEISTFSPGNHGGNMDTKEITIDSVLYLPVFAKGAKLAIGDLHAIMGDGEIPICGVEIGGHVHVKLELIKDRICEWPLLEDAHHYYVVGSAKTLDEACEIATESMFKFLYKNVSGMESNDIIRLMGMVGDLRISQIVNPLKTAKFMVPKDTFNVHIR
jgi:amidase